VYTAQVIDRQQTDFDTYNFEHLSSAVLSVRSSAYNSTELYVMPTLWRHEVSETSVHSLCFFVLYENIED